MTVYPVLTGYLELFQKLRPRIRNSERISLYVDFLLLVHVPPITREFLKNRLHSQIKPWKQSKVLVLSRHRREENPTHTGALLPCRSESRWCVWRDPWRRVADGQTIRQRGIGRRNASPDSLGPTHPLLGSPVAELKQKSEDDGTHGCGPYRSAWQGGRTAKDGE